MGPDSQSKDPRPAGAFDKGTLVSSCQENKIVMECYLLSEPKIRGYRKRMLNLLLQKGMFWVSEQILVDQANTIRRNSWITELEIEELERKVTGSDSVIVEDRRSVEALTDYVGEDVRNVLPEMFSRRA